jgi:hypothetical protein
MAQLTDVFFQLIITNESKNLVKPGPLGIININLWGKWDYLGIFPSHLKDKEYLGSVQLVGWAGFC